MNMRVVLHLILTQLCIALPLTAQEYPYSMTVTTAPYVPLSSFTVARPAFDGAATKVAADVFDGFSFWGEPVTEFTVYPRGAIAFATPTNSWEGGMFGLNSDYVPRSQIDPLLSSTFGYEIQGMLGSRVLVFEWRDIALASATGGNVDSINYQVRFHEASDVVEVHVGPSHVASSFTNFDEPINGPILGIYHSQGQGTDERAMYFTGDPASPQMNFTESGFPSGSTIGLNAFPLEGTIYRFTQTSSSVGDDHHRATTSARCDGTEMIVKLGGVGERSLVLFDALGRERGRIDHLAADATRASFSIDGLASGIYLIEMSVGREREVVKVVVP